MVYLKLYINYIAKNKISDIGIDNEKTFGELRKIVAETFGIDLDTFSLVVNGYYFSCNNDSKKLKEIYEISNGCTLFVAIIKRELWTIFVDLLDKHEVIDIKIYNNQTFLELKNEVSKYLKWNVNDVELVGPFIYGYYYNSKQIKDIDGLSNEITLYAVKKVAGG